MPPLRSSSLLLLAGCSRGVWLYEGTVPSEISWVAAIGEVREGTFAGTPLRPWTAASATNVELAEGSEPDELWVIGFRQATIDSSQSTPDDSPIVTRAPGQRALPPVDWSAVGPSGGGELSVSSREWSLTSKWVGPCPEDACASFPIGNATPIDVGVDASAFSVVPWDASRTAATVAAVSRSSGETELLRVDELGVSRVADSSTTARWVSSFMGDDDRLWVLTRDARLVSGRPERLETTARVDTQGRVVSKAALDGVSSRERTEIYISTEHGSLDRYDGSLLVRIAHREMTTEGVTDVARVGVDWAVAIYAETHEVVELRDGSVSRNELPFEPVSVAFVPSLGVLIGGSRSGFESSAGLYVFADGLVELLSGATDSNAYGSRLILPLGDGVAFGGVRGFFSFLLPGLQGCPARAITASSVSSLAALSWTTLMATTGRDGLVPEILRVSVDEGKARFPVGCGRR